MKNKTRRYAWVPVFAASVLLSNQVLAQTSSPFAPPEEELGIYTTNSGPGLDTGCTFRNGGPLIIQLYVPATMNPDELDSNGYLVDADKLVNNKVIGRNAKISFPTYDIDDKADVSGIAPEVDLVSFNGAVIKTLEGFNNQWVNDSFPVDISKVKFNQMNEIKIDIDVDNTRQAWCMSVDWVSIAFDAAAPYVLAHGISADLETWDNDAAPGVLATLDASGVLYERFSTDAKGSVTDNARDLKGQIQVFLDKVKSKKVNIIAHSKGGLDSQALAFISQPEFEILSLSTLSTPHLGSSIADVQLLQRAVADRYVQQSNDPNGFLTSFLNRSIAGFGNAVGLLGPQTPGLNDLTTQAASSALRAGLRDNITNLNTMGADAGGNCLRDITNDEIRPMFNGWNIFSYVYNALRESYRIICDVESATLVDLDIIFIPTPQGGSVYTTLTYDFVENSVLHQNDVVVGVRSANPSWGNSLGVRPSTNHSSIKNGANVQRFLDLTIQLR
jgi:hypothetical protein